MGIKYRVLGNPGFDNAVYLEVRRGNSIHRLLFDCGQGCLDGLSRSEIRGVRHLFFSHFHMDHVAGFDAFFRVNCDRPEGSVNVWGPPGAIEILHHRFRGYLWNLIDGRPGTWIVNEVGAGEVRSASFHAPEAFAVVHHHEPRNRTRCLVDEPAYVVEALTLDHGTPCLGYLVRERDKLRIRKGALKEFGAESKRWIATLKDPAVPDDQRIEISGETREVGSLRSRMIETTPGDSLGLLTDFRMSGDDFREISRCLTGCKTLICEAQYLGNDTEMAGRNHHLTSRQAAVLAAGAGVGRLILFHVSNRYSERQRGEALCDAQEIFPRTSWPDTW